MLRGPLPQQRLNFLEGPILNAERNQRFDKTRRNSFNQFFLT